MASSKFILGSAQFGLDYGISNIHGKTSIKEVSKILLSANQFGINLIDTAPVYGDAEKVLGNLRESADFQFISKIPKMYQEESIDEYLLRIKNIFSSTLINLNKSNLYGLLIHDSTLMKDPKKDLVIKFLLELKQQNKVKKIGVSFYDPEEVEIIFSTFTPDIIQIPVNLLDQRFLKMELLEYFKTKNVEIHARSVFLQGALLIEEGNSFNQIESLRPILQNLTKELIKLKMTSLEASILFLFSNEMLDKVLIGVTNALELKECLESCKNKKLPKYDFSNFAIEDMDIIDPRRWKK